MKQLNKLPSQVALQERKKFQDFANTNKNFLKVQKFFKDCQSLDLSIDDVLRKFKQEVRFAVKDSMNAEENEQEVKLDFELVKHDANRSPQGAHYSFAYPRFTINARLETPWQLSSLSITHPDEKDLTPESLSSLKLF